MRGAYVITPSLSNPGTLDWGEKWGAILWAYKTNCFGSIPFFIFSLVIAHDPASQKLVPYYRFQINCSVLPKSEIFYTPNVKNLGLR